MTFLIESESVKNIGVLVAAATGIWNVWWQIKGKNDRILVGLGTVNPRVYEEAFLHVVNLSDHQITLKDWGFIEEDLKLLSMPLAWETESLATESFINTGDPILSGRSSVFESGYITQRQPIGAYAITVTQTQPRLYFDTNTQYWKRIFIRLRLIMQPHYFNW